MIDKNTLYTANADEIKKRWTKEKLTQYVNDIIEFMDTCKNETCIYQENNHCTRGYIALEYAMDLGKLARMGDAWKDVDMQKDGDKICLSAHYIEDDEELSDEEKELADKIEKSLKEIR